jgi:serine/threonine-protein kinase
LKLAGPGIGEERLFLTQRPGGSLQIKLIDFGTSKLMREEAAPSPGEKTATMVFGFSCYGSPELIRKASHLDARTDVWSLGAIFYYMLAARPPFGGDRAVLILDVMRGEPSSVRRFRPELPPEIDLLLGWAMAKDVDRRFVGVHAFAHALTPFASDEGRVLIQRIGAIAAASKRRRTEARREQPSGAAADPQTQPLAPARPIAPESGLPPAVTPPPSPAPGVALTSPPFPPSLTRTPAAPSPAGSPRSSPRMVAVAAASAALGLCSLAGAVWLLKHGPSGPTPAPSTPDASARGQSPAPGTASASAPQLQAGSEAPPIRPAPQEGVSKAGPPEDSPSPGFADTTPPAETPQKLGKAAAPPPSAKAPPTATATPPSPIRTAAPNGSEMGTLVATATGGTCKFSVDGVSKGAVSTLRLPLKAGVHTVTCLTSAGATKSRNVTITTGKPTMVMFKP